MKDTDTWLVMAKAVFLSACGSSEEEMVEEELVVRDSVVCYSLFAQPLRYPVETKSAFELKDSLLNAARKNYEFKR